MSWLTDELALLDPRIATLAAGSHAMPAEHRLLVAVLEDALRCYRGRAEKELGERTRARLAAEAAMWFASGADYPFTFVAICAALGLDPSAVRRRLMRINVGRKMRIAAASNRVTAGRYRPSGRRRVA